MLVDEHGQRPALLRDNAADLLEEPAPRQHLLAQDGARVVAVLADQQHAIDRQIVAAKGQCGADAAVDRHVVAVRELQPDVLPVNLVDIQRRDAGPRRNEASSVGKPARNLLTSTPAWLFGKNVVTSAAMRKDGAMPRYEDGRGPVRTPASSPRNPGGGHYVRRRVAFPFSVRVARLPGGSGSRPLPLP